MNQRPRRKLHSAQACCAVVLTALAIPQLLVAGTDPLAPFAVEPGSTTIDLQPAPAADAAGRLLLAWTRRHPGGADEAVAARLDVEGHPLTAPFVWGSGLVLDAASLGQGFFALRRDSPNGGAWGQPLSLEGSASGSQDPLGVLRFLVVRGDPRGGALAVGSGPDGAVGVAYGADGQSSDEPFVLERGAVRLDLGIDAHGNRVLAFTDSAGRLFARRYSSASRPVGSRIAVLGAGAVAFRIAVLPDGRFVIVYHQPPEVRLFARAFAANGRPVGSAFPVSNGPVEAADGLDVAPDSDGTLLAVWKIGTGSRSRIIGRFVSAAGATLGAPFVLGRTSSEPPPASVGSPRAVRVAPGSFKAFWVRQGGKESDVHLRGQQVFGGPGGDDPCIVLREALRCDLRHDGGGAEVFYRLPLEVGERPLLGDLDGDGRDEPCVFRDHRFLCDLEKDGAFETTYDYGEPGDVPLLGKIDGFGPDDLCRFDGSAFRCARLPLGSAPEVVIAFGGPQDRPALGDVDGDGDDDPCIFTSGRFLCDSAHDGGAPERQQVFPIAVGETPLVGDVDGDGKADPCAARGGTFRCALSATGRVQTFLLGSQQALPLLGNVDGR